MWRKTKSVVSSSLTIVGGGTIVFIGGSLAFRYQRRKKQDAVLPNTILTMDLTKPFREGPSSPMEAIIGALSGQSQSLSMFDVVETLKAAEKDDRIAGVVARLGSGEPIPLSQVQELRGEIEKFTSSGKKFAFAFGDTYSKGHYYLASAFDRVYVEPTGDVDLSGVGMSPIFFRGLLDKLKVKLNTIQAYEYKGALNMFTDTELSKYHRENYQAILDSVLGQYVAGIAKGRAKSEESVRECFNRPSIPSEEALKEGLVDSIGYSSHVRLDLAFRLHDKPLPDWRDASAIDALDKPSLESMLKQTPFLAFERYASSQKRIRQSAHKDSAPHVALVVAEGPISRGSRAAEDSDGSRRIVGARLVAALAHLSNVPSVKAVVLRVQSPGGDAIASDSIAYAVRELSGSKPVIASMGSVAASGGYYISAPATEIFACGSTLTGSIGVAGGKFVVDDTLRSIGVSNDVVENGKHAGMNSVFREYTKEEWAIVNNRIDGIYRTFVDTVASGRGMSRDAVHEVAKGRVWTGEEALEKGLVDTVGGLSEAIDRAKALAIERDSDLSTPDALHVVEYPKPRSISSVLSGAHSEAARDFYSCVQPQHGVDAIIGDASPALALDEVIGRVLSRKIRQLLFTQPEECFWSEGNGGLAIQARDQRGAQELSKAL